MFPQDIMFQLMSNEANFFDVAIFDLKYVFELASIFT